MIKQGEAYYMLKLTYSSMWDYDNKKHLMLPRLWKIQKVVIGEALMVEQKLNTGRIVVGHFKYDTRNVQMHRILSPRTKTAIWEKIEVGTMVGDTEPKEKKWSYKSPLMFFKTEEDVIEKILSIRNEIELYQRMDVERYRQSVMTKISKMNTVKLKLDALAEKYKA